MTPSPESDPIEMRVLWDVDRVQGDLPPDGARQAPYYLSETTIDTKVLDFVQFGGACAF